MAVSFQGDQEERWCVARFGSVGCMRTPGAEAMAPRLTYWQAFFRVRFSLFDDGCRQRTKERKNKVRTSGEPSAFSDIKTRSPLCEVAVPPMRAD